MRSLFRRMTLVFTAGCIGGLVNSFAVWYFGDAGISSALGVTLAPALTPTWLYPRLVWGGIWGMLFLVPFPRRAIQRGILFSIGPTLVQLFIVFPVQAGKGNMGLELGTMTPLLVVFFNVVWGVSAALWMRFIGEK